MIDFQREMSNKNRNSLPRTPSQLEGVKTSVSQEKVIRNLTFSKHDILITSYKGRLPKKTT